MFGSLRECFTRLLPLLPEVQQTQPDRIVEAAAPRLRIFGSNNVALKPTQTIDQEILHSMPMITPGPDPRHLEARAVNSLAGWITSGTGYSAAYCASGLAYSVAGGYGQCCDPASVCSFVTGCAGSTLIYQGGKTNVCLAGNTCVTDAVFASKGAASSARGLGCNTAAHSIYIASPPATTSPSSNGGGTSTTAPSAFVQTTAPGTIASRSYVPVTQTVSGETQLTTITRTTSGTLTVVQSSTSLIVANGVTSSIVVYSTFVSTGLIPVALVTTAPNPPCSGDACGGQKKSNIGAIAGGAAGGLVALLAVVGGLIFLLKRRSDKKKADRAASGMYGGAAAAKPPHHDDTPEVVYAQPKYNSPAVGYPPAPQHGAYPQPQPYPDAYAAAPAPAAYYPPPAANSGYAGPSPITPTQSPPPAHLRPTSELSATSSPPPRSSGTHLTAAAAAGSGYTLSEPSELSAGSSPHVSYMQPEMGYSSLGAQPQPQPPPQAPQPPQQGNYYAEAPPPPPPLAGQVPYPYPGAPTYDSSAAAYNGGGGGGAERPPLSAYQAPVQRASQVIVGSPPTSMGAAEVRAMNAQGGYRG